MQRHNRSARLNVQCLEDRTVPAVTIVNPTTASFVDVDGDAVTVRVSKGAFADDMFVTVPMGAGEQLQTIHLGGGGFDRANLWIDARKKDNGDGLVNVGFIDSTGHDLGHVIVDGDLGRINAGNSVPPIPALLSLNVRSMGRFGTDTQTGAASVFSQIRGALGRLVVKGDITGMSVIADTNADVDATIGSISIGGSLIDGRVSSSSHMGPVRIGGDIRGGSISSKASRRIILLERGIDILSC
jgi:hypothetical protein